MNDFEKSKFWRDIYDRTIVKVDEADAKKISRMIFDMRNNRKLRNIGEGSGRELIAALGVFLAEHDFEGAVMPRGHKVGTKLKPESKCHRRQFCVKFTEDETEDFYDFCRMTDESYSSILRKCFKIVYGLQPMERERLWRVATWN